MHGNICVSIENVKNSKLLALFSTLEESDKDIVISMSESLVERFKNNLNLKEVNGRQIISSNKLPSNQTAAMPN
jgi:hypothetical protein